MSGRGLAGFLSAEKLPVPLLRPARRIPMEQLHVNLVLDKEMLGKVITYYIYRSREMESGRPTIDGVYIQRGTVGINPPEHMKLLLEW